MLHQPSVARHSGRTCIDLFSGAGGLAVGFRAAGWSILAANDIDPDAGETFRHNFPETSFFEGPISALSANALLAECNLKSGDLDCLIGGPPCQSFSYNNHQRSAEDARAKLFENYLKLVEGLKPKTLIMENVPGILTIGDNSVIKEIETRLAALEYDCAVETLSAEKYGTPQIRRRVFIVASRIGLGRELLPAPTHGSKKGRRRPKNSLPSKDQKELWNTKKRLVTVQQAIGDLPNIENGSGKQTLPNPKKRATTLFQRSVRKGARALYNHVCHNLTDAMLKRIKHIPEGGNWRNIPRNLLTDGMKRARKSDHTKRYGRLSRTGLASTILTKCDPHWGAYVHPTQNRTISVREAARLQGFPDKFKFAGLRIGKQYTQVGNAVPIPLARALAETVLKHLHKRMIKNKQVENTRQSANEKSQKAA